MYNQLNVSVLGITRLILTLAHTLPKTPVFLYVGTPWQIFAIWADFLQAGRGVRARDRRDGPRQNHNGLDIDAERTAK